MNESQMPLREIFLREHGICVKCYGGENCKYNDVLEDCPIYQQLLAHYSAIRREFAEKVCKLLKNELRIISPTTEEKLYRDIRAMAEKEG